MALKYFQDIFSTSTPPTRTISEVLEQVPHKVSLNMNRILGRACTAEEVHTVLSQMGPTKALGPECLLCFFNLSGLR